MPINNIHFTSIKHKDGTYGHYPLLPVKIVNPHKKLSTKTTALIDTGADECAIPAYIAELLGHDLNAGTSKSTLTGDGEIQVYSHTSIFKIFHPDSEEHLYTTTETSVDCMPNLAIVLLGVKSFLDSFILKIDYPQKMFSINYPNS